MDALELQAALVKLDPATTVTPIRSNLKLVPHPRIAFTLDIDENNLTFQSAQNTEQTDQKSSTDSANVRQLPVTNQNNLQNSQNPQITKCNMAEVRWRQPSIGVNMLYHTYPPHRGGKHNKHHAKEKRHHHHHTIHHQHHKAHVVSKNESEIELWRIFRNVIQSEWIRAIPSHSKSFRTNPKNVKYPVWW